jgi:L-ascorbate metabolism protein UlaG (beta-lactamase superfamily)
MRSLGAPRQTPTVRLTAVRNATLLLELAGRRVLVDPALDDAGARPQIENTPAAARASSRATRSC